MRGVDETLTMETHEDNVFGKGRIRTVPLFRKMRTSGSLPGITLLQTQSEVMGSDHIPGDKLKALEMITYENDAF